MNSRDKRAVRRILAVMETLCVENGLMPFLLLVLDREAVRTQGIAVIGPEETRAAVREMASGISLALAVYATEGAAEKDRGGLEGIRPSDN